MSLNISYLIFVDAEGEDRVFILDKENADRIQEQIMRNVKVKELSEEEAQSFFRKLKWVRRIGESTQGGSP